jgi:hypothetical protein
MAKFFADLIKSFVALIPKKGNQLKKHYKHVSPKASKKDNGWFV